MIRLGCCRQKPPASAAPPGQSQGRNSGKRGCSARWGEAIELGLPAPQSNAASGGEICGEVSLQRALQCRHRMGIDGTPASVAQKEPKLMAKSPTRKDIDALTHDKARRI